MLPSLKYFRLLIALPLFAVMTTPAQTKRIATQRIQAKPKASEKMRELVCDISKYARGIKPGFIIIPQNGIEVAFNDLNPQGKTHSGYMAAIDGVAVEDLFFDGKLQTDTYRLHMLREFRHEKQVLFSDYITTDASVEKVADLSHKENFLFFPRTKTNEHYHTIPKNIPDENSRDVTKLAEAKNYLYLINASAYKTKKDYLDALAATNYDLVAIDLYYDDAPLTPKDIEPLKTKANGAKRLVLSYVNIGAAENWRPYWKKGWKINNPGWIKKKYHGYDDEFYVQYWHPEWQKIITGNKNSYVKKILDAGFDGAFLDNIEAYYALYHK